MATATKGAMVMATRVASNNMGNGDGNGEVMGDGNGDEGGGHATATRAMATATAMMWKMATALRVAGDIEGLGKGGKGNGDSNKCGGQQRG